MKHRDISMYMMSKVILPLALILLPAVVRSAPVTQAQMDAVGRLADYNGVALACRQFDEVKRIKQILIDNLPKRRELGQLFEDRTNESFVAFTGARKPCPSPAEFAEHVDEAAAALRQSFAQ